MSKEEFYRAFEDRYRGSRELVASRVRFYLDFLEPLKKFHADVEVLDLGCGRGEWLELLRAEGFAGLGIDLDEGMLAACHESNLDVVQADAIDYLCGLPSDCKVVISGFHIAEHLPFDSLRKLVSESLRVLKPGGLLILETPNPANLFVGASMFYLDPTHERPIPQELLSFLTEYYGFSRSKVFPLQERPELVNTEAVSLFDVLTGVSPDYAVVAQKAGEGEYAEALVSALTRRTGLTLEALARRHDMTVERMLSAAMQKQGTSHEQAFAAIAVKLEDVRSRVDAGERQRADLEHLFGLLDTRARELETTLALIGLPLAEAGTVRTLAALDEALGEVAARVEKNGAEILSLQKMLLQKQQELAAIQGSWSWRLTLPLRLIAHSARALHGPLTRWSRNAVDKPTTVVKSLLKKGNRWLARHPGLRQQLKTRLPRLYGRLRSLAHAQVPAPVYNPGRERGMKLDIGSSRSQPGATLTVDEILERIRRELANKENEGSS